MKWMTKQSLALVLLLNMTTVIAPEMVRTAAAASKAAVKPGAQLAAIESISMSDEANGGALLIKLSSPATYTSYKTTAPLRLVLDLSQTTQGAITAPIVINKGNFKTVTVSRYDTDAGVLTRVDIELARDAEAVISAVPDHQGVLKIAFPESPAPAAAAAEAVPAAAMPEPVVAKEQAAAAQEIAAAPVEAVKATSEAPSQVPPAPEQPAKASAQAASASSRTLTAISVKGGSIVLDIEGGVGEFKSFRLNKPERLVVDLFEVKSALKSRIVPVNAAGVALARIGNYPGKIRVVFDALGGKFPETVARATEKGITLAPNAKQPAENQAAARSEKAVEAVPRAETKTLDPVVPAVPAAPAVERSAAKPAAVPSARASSPASVEMIDFQVVDGISRISVKLTGEAVVEAPVSSPGFVTLTVRNAALPKRLQRSFETKGFVSPVLRVTPIVVKTRKGSDARIRIALRAAVPFEYKHEGDMVFVDFKNPEGLSAERPYAGPQERRPDAAGSAKSAAARETEISTELAPLTEAAAKPLDTVKTYKGRKVTLEFADAEVRKIFQLLSEVSSKNFVLGDDVTGTISIKLVNVPWDQALDIILDTKGLDKREEGNIIIIKGKGKFKSQAEEELELKKQLSRAIELKTETFSINYADLGSLVGQFTALKSDRGTIVQDTRTNKVIVKDIPQAIEDMRKLKEQLDVPEKQVMIEARIVEATSTFTRSLGVSWGVHATSPFGMINQLDTGFGGLAATPPPVAGVAGTPGGSLGISFGHLGPDVKLDMRLNAAASAGLIKIVSTPKVATINNKSAKITQGQSIPYTSSTSDKVETKFIEAALSLEVTPHINANGTIGMKIDAKNDSPGTSSGGAAPPINKKQATTEMLLRDGETTVIGGIYVDSDTESDDGVPFLMDIPFFGHLFKSNTKQKTKTELLIFITPRILGAI